MIITILFSFPFQSLSSPLSPCRRHQMPPPHIALKDLVPEQILDKEPPTPPVTDADLSSQKPFAPPREKGQCASLQHLCFHQYIFYLLSCHMCSLRLYNPTGGNSPRSKGNRGGSHSVGCLRHGTLSNAQAVKAVYLLMGGAAASSAIGYLGTCSLANLEAKAADLPLNADFSGMAPERVYHGAGGPALDSLHYNSFDFEVADSDFDGFDCGGFTF